MKNNFQVGEKYVIENLERSNLSLGTKIMLYPVTDSKIYKNGNTWNNFPSGTSWMRLYRSGGSPSIMKISFWDSSNNLLSDVSLTDGNFKVYGEFVNLQDNLNQDLPTDSDEYIYIRNHSRQASMLFELDKLNCESHVVNKLSGSNLLFVDYAFGTPREEFNILTPSITFEYDSVPDFNYVHIPSLQRYYFVTNITCVRNNVYRIDLKVDVLCTYASDIDSQDAFVTRNENTYDVNVEDNRLPLESKQTTLYYNYLTLVGTSQINVTFKTSSLKNNIVISTNTKKLSSLSTHYEIPVPNSSDKVDGFAFSERKIFSFIPHERGGLDVNNTFEQSLIGFYTASFNQSAIADSVLNVIALPFDISSVELSYYSTYLSIADSYIGYDGSLRSGNLTPKDTTDNDSDETIKAYAIQTPISRYLILEDFDFPYPYLFGEYLENSDLKWLAYEPYANYEIFVPYYGWVKVNSKDVLGKRLLVYYVVNYITGASNVFIQDYTAKKVIFSASCQLGTLLSVSTSNKTELTAQKNSNALNLVLGLISSSIGIGVGVASGNPLAVTGGVLSGGKTIADTINKSSLLFERTQATLHDGNSALYSPQKVSLKVTIRKPLNNIDATYKHIQGLPLNKNMNLASLTGYTEIPEMHYVPSYYNFITKTEIDEIISLAKNGIIL